MNAYAMAREREQRQWLRRHLRPLQRVLYRVCGNAYAGGQVWDAVYRRMCEPRLSIVASVE